MRYMALRVTISVVVVVLIVVHLVWPDKKVDSITLGLIIVAALPWLGLLIESAEAPGGWKVKFRDLKEATAEITGHARRPGTYFNKAAPDARQRWPQWNDANLALVAMRVEIEKRLRRLAERYELRSSHSLTGIVDELRQRGVLTKAEASGLERVINAGNRAAHGAEVDPQIADYAHDWGQEIIGVLEQKLVG